MSVKSRQQTLRRELEKPDHALLHQRETAAKAKKAAADYLYVVLFLLAALAVLAVLMKDNVEEIRNFLMGAAATVPVIFWLCVSFFRCYGFARSVETVIHSSEEAREFDCVGVRVFTCPVSKHSSEIFGLLLRAKSGEKYRYIFPQSQLDYWGAKRALKKALRGQRVNCTCYAGTNVIKSLGDILQKS